MKKIGNILFLKDKNSEQLYNMCSESTIKAGIPSLVVGWDNVKKLYPEKSMIGWKINENTYWTFGKREKRDRFERDIIEFKRIATEQLIKSVKYEFIDLLTCDSDCKKYVFSLIRDTSKKVVYSINNMIYMYHEGENTAFGISLLDIKYEGISPAKLINELKSNKNVLIVENIPYNIKNMFSNSLYAIPYLYSD